jgi:tetratricopeptide (TPR) repeat protein
MMTGKLITRVDSVFTLIRASICIGSLVACAAAGAAPYRPADDAQVLERLPPSAAAPKTRELATLRRQLAQQPRDAELAARVADGYFAIAVADSDPRYIGYAESAIGPWWNEARLPVALRVSRAKVLQFHHQFDRALADLGAAVREEPGHAEAWAWVAAIQMVRADYAAARSACQALAPHTTAINAVACLASVDAATGNATAAAAAIAEALRGQEASPDERLWALTRLGEIHSRLGRPSEAEGAFREALALGIEDAYLLFACADLLLEQGRGGEVMALLKDRVRSDPALLRLAIAAKATGDKASLERWRAMLAARFDAAHARGDTTHRKEEARFALAVLGDPARALPLARANFEAQSEPADAQLLLEAALAARESGAAAPALRWMRESGIESRHLERLRRELEALK